MKFQIFVFFLSALVTQVLCQTSIELGPEDPAQLFTVQIRNFTFPTVENATFRCTGTIFDRRHVVTAASCVDPDSNNMIVAYGSVNKTWTAESGSFEFLEWVRPHPQFQANNPRANNVAVLRVSRVGLQNVFVTAGIYLFQHRYLVWLQTQFHVTFQILSTSCYLKILFIF